MRNYIPYLITIIFSLTFNQYLTAQQQKSICIKDKISRVPLAGATIYFVEKETGTTSNKQGCFSFSYTPSQLPVEIKISFVGYKTRKITIDSSFNATIWMEPKVFELEAFEISSEKHKNISQKVRSNILDYEFFNDNILLAGVSKRKHHLFLLTTNGDTIVKKTFQRKKIKRLYKDCLGGVYIITRRKDIAYQVFHKKDELLIDYPVPFDSLHTLMGNCVTQFNQHIFFEQDYLGNQLKSFTQFNKATQKTLKWKIIEYKKGTHFFRNYNSTMKRSIEYHRRIVASLQFSGGRIPSFDNPQNNMAYEVMTKYPPIYVPLIPVNKTLYLFDHSNGIISSYDTNLTPIDSTYIDYHLSDFWKRKVLADEKTQKVYSLFEKGGFSILKQINLEKGEVIKEIKIKEFKNIRKPHIHNDHIFFLFKSPYNQSDLSQLYRVELEN